MSFAEVGGHEEDCSLARVVERQRGGCISAATLPAAGRGWGHYQLLAQPIAGAGLVSHGGEIGRAHV